MPNDGDARDETAVPEQETATANGQEPDDGATAPDSNDTAAAQTPDEGVGEFDPGEILESLQQELAEVKEQLLRKSADFENYRKRMAREKEEYAAYANRELLLDIVPIIDDFERAIKSGEESHDFNAFHDGIVMIEKQFTSMLERKWKLSRFDSKGEEFDPQRHEAMMTEEVPGHDTSMVLEDFQKGYTLHERVLRPAKVKVSMPAPAAEKADDADAQEKAVDESAASNE